MQQILFYTFASAYGESSYNSSTYNGQSTSGAGSAGAPTVNGTPGVAGSPTGTAGNGVLTNTGMDILVFVSLACLIIFAALVIRLVRRKPRAATPSE